MFSLMRLCGVIIALVLHAAPSWQRALANHRPEITCSGFTVPVARVSGWTVRFMKTLADSGGVEEYDVNMDSVISLVALGAARPAYIMEKDSTRLCGMGTADLRDHLENENRGPCAPPENSGNDKYRCILQSEACKNMFDIVVPLATEAGGHQLTQDDTKRQIFLTTNLVTFERDQGEHAHTDAGSHVSWDLRNFGIDMSLMELDESKEVYFTRTSDDGRKQRLYIDVSLKCEEPPQASALPV